MVARIRLYVTLHVHCPSCSYSVDTFHLSHRLQEWQANLWISLARGIHCCPNLYVFLLSDRRPYTYCGEYVHIYTPLTAYRLHMNYRCYQITLQWNIFTQIGRGAKCWLDKFIMKAPVWRWLGKYVTLDKTFCKLLFKQDVREDTVTPTFSSLTHSSRKPLFYCKQM
jgi:hypothetical protein